MKKHLIFSALLALLAIPESVVAQKDSNKNINYKPVSDEPFKINKLWLHLQPISTDIFMTNFSIGYGMQANYFTGVGKPDNLDIKIAFRSSYGQRADFARNAASDGSVNQNSSVLVGGRRLPVVNDFKRWNIFEIGACYHIKDSDDKRGKTKIMLTSKNKKIREYALVDYIMVDSKIREIMGARLGVVAYGTTTNLSAAMRKQGKDLVGDDGSILKADGSTLNTDGTTTLNNENRIYSNISSTGIYIGGSYSIIRNVVVKPDRFPNLANNIMLNSFFDLIIAPTTKVEDVKVLVNNTPTYINYDVSPLKVNKIGWRAGFDIMYNQDYYWSFGGEIGARPTLGKRGMYVSARIGLPVFSFRFKGARPASTVGGGLK